jgi:hypothetical protein
LKIHEKLWINPSQIGKKDRSGARFDQVCADNSCQRAEFASAWMRVAAVASGTLDSLRKLGSLPIAVNFVITS